ncbi:helix-turn-helix domain-containing protein [Mangrovicoccus algicola]|uniref:Helix-turn-helix transcriptional regulator n=1 Tax=Mangrovicoccus algicola TaxID=2771008 RepID=A0A8J6YWM5_9RHOB|nr:XRE family transcriptional regulator [Mangrovicoccus algicola]MBE3639107.1 helix-turn-helix transcriptional regulator [Mangrovicoccus algicola]
MTKDAADTPDQRITAEVGRRLRARRKECGWTLGDLSERSGVSVPAISKIEIGQSSPSFDTLMRLIRPLQLNFVEILDPPTESAPSGRLTSTRIGEAERHSTDHYDYEVHSSNLRGKVMVPLKMRIRTHEVPPPDEWSIHRGEEYIYVLSGTLGLHTQHYAPLVLKVGESAYLDSTMRHAFTSEGPEDAEILSICLSIVPFER